MTRRGALAAFLSFVFPGLGQAYNRQARLAWALAVPTALVVVATGLAVTLAGSGLLSRLLDVRFLIGLIVLNVAFLGWRLLAISQAHARREPISLRRWSGWLTCGLLLVTIAMHGLPTFYAARAIDTLHAVSLGGDGAGGGLGFAPIPGASQLPQAGNGPDVRLGERVNFLLVGVDSAPSRSTALTDTMLVVSIDPEHGGSAMISIPRDLYGVPLPDGRVYNAKLNSLMAYANARPQEFPAGGAATLKATVGELLGVEIHYLAAVSLVGFTEAIDAVGGVDVTVQRAISDPTYRDVDERRVGFFLQPGTYHMDGQFALAYVRSRKGIGDSDFTRADRQQQLLEALRAKLTAGNLVLSLPGLLDALQHTIATDVPAGRLSELAQALQDADMSRVRRVVLQPPEYMTPEDTATSGYVLHPDLAAIRAIGQELLAPRAVRTPPPTEAAPS
jgi:LCP family protein required for cell wall assembly